MISYYKPVNQVKTALSGGRKHYAYRSPVIVTETYDYTVTFGETYYSLAKSVLKDESLWYVIADLNQAKDPFELVVGQDIKLPEVIVENTYSKPSIFL